MNTVTLATRPKQNHYDIRIGVEIVDKINNFFNFSRYSGAFVVTDRNVAKYWLDKVTKNIPIPVTTQILAAGETNKTTDTLADIWSAMHDARCDRKSLVITLGGGVVGDMGAFAAATYMRGVDCLQIPTTLLAQVDSSIGGKTAADLGGIKNLVGTFSQPAAVVIDTTTCATLPDREFISGFAEMIKHGLISDPAYLDAVTSKTPRNFNALELQHLIDKSCKIKASVVEADEKESGLRKALNFGHTIGHAIESLSLQTSTPLLHGEAVSIGMVAESELAAIQNYLSAKDIALVRQKLIAAGLPVSNPGFSTEDIINKMRSDKKNEFGKINFTLLDKIGSAVWDQQVDEKNIKIAIERITDEQA